MEDLLVTPVETGQEEFLTRIHNFGFRDCIDGLGVMKEFRENRAEDIQKLVRDPDAKLWVAFLGDIPVGYACCRMVKEVGEDTVCKVVYEPTDTNFGQSRIVVLPEYRRRGIASALMSKSLEQVQDLGAEVALVYAHSDNLGASALLADLGFVHEEVFYYRKYSEKEPFDHDSVYLELDLRQPLNQVPLNSKVTVRAPSVEDLPVLTRIFGECAPWAYGPNPSMDQVRGWLEEPWGEVQLVGVVEGEVVGAIEFSARGQLGVPGVLPEYQRKGIGTALLFYLLQWMQERGHRRAIAETGIIAENAIGLYRKLGFSQIRAQWRWHKVLS